MSPRKKSGAATVFARRLTELRKERHLTQAELAEQIGLSRGMIGYYESCAKNPTLETLQRFADFFGVSVGELVEEPENGPGRPGPATKLEQQMERVKSLPPIRQRMIVNMLQAALNTE